jgi:hypothetical protein
MGPPVQVRILFFFELVGVGVAGALSRVSGFMLPNDADVPGLTILVQALERAIAALPASLSRADCAGFIGEQLLAEHEGRPLALAQAEPLAQAALTELEAQLETALGTAYGQPHWPLRAVSDALLSQSLLSRHQTAQRMVEAAARASGLVRRGCGTHVCWASADDDVTKEHQEQWAHHLEGLRNGQGHHGNPVTMARHGITADEVALWPDHLAKTDEVADWSVLSFHDASEARQAKYASWRKVKQTLQTAQTPRGQLAQAQDRALPSQLSGYQQMMWTDRGGDEIAPLLSSGAIALVDAHWMVAFYLAGGRTLGPRQGLPVEAFITLDELKTAGTPLESLPIVVQSYMWLQPDAPDPQGYTLSRAIILLKALTCQRPEQLRNFGASTYGPCGTQRFGVFVDWLGLHQKPRAFDEEPKFRQALSSLDLIYSHPCTIVMRCTKLPEGYPEGYELPEGSNVSEYSNRGWCFTESAWSSLIKNRNQNFDLGMLDGTEQPLLHEMQRLCSKGARKMPLLPDDFDAALKEKRFTNSNSDHPLCSSLYRSAFNQRLGSATHLKLNTMDLVASDMVQLANVIASKVLLNVEVIVLHTNKISGVGVKALTGAIKPTTLPKMQYLYIGGNPFGDEGAEAIASMITARNVPLLKELDVRNGKIGPKGLQSIADAINSGADAVPCLTLLVSRKNLGDDTCVQDAMKLLASQRH